MRNGGYGDKVEGMSSLASPTDPSECSKAVPKVSSKKKKKNQLEEFG